MFHPLRRTVTSHVSERSDDNVQVLVVCRACPAACGCARASVPDFRTPSSVTEAWSESSGQVPSQLGNDEGRPKATVSSGGEPGGSRKVHTRADRTGQSGPGGTGGGYEAGCAGTRVQHNLKSPSYLAHYVDSTVTCRKQSGLPRENRYASREGLSTPRGGPIAYRKSAEGIVREGPEP